MAKQSRGKDPETSARRKLSDAQAKLQAAQESRARVVADGEKQLEKLRQKVTRQVDKATKELERRATRVAEAEARLTTLKSRKTSAQATRPTQIAAAAESAQDATATPAATATRLEAIEGAVDEGAVEPNAVEPDGAAYHLEDLQAAALREHDEDSILVLNGISADPLPAATSTGALDVYEQRLLDVLGDEYREQGATFTQWLAGAKMSKRTFLRARKTLVDLNLVRHEGEGQGARYFPVAPPS